MGNNDMLSQEEINALLNVTRNDEDKGEEPETGSEAASDEISTDKEECLNPLEIDTLGEIGNISLGSSATTLATILGQKVDITTPNVSLVKKTGIKEEFPYEHVSLQVNYLDGFDGENIFLMKASDATIISDIMLGGEGVDPNKELTDLELSAVQEAMNQMMGASATSMSTVFDKRVDISPPLVEYKEIDRLEEVHNNLEGDVFVRVSFNLKVGDLIDSEIMQLIPLPFAKTLVDQLLNPEEETPVEAEKAAAEQSSTLQVESEADTAEAALDKSASIPPESDTENQYIGKHLNEQSTVQSAAFSDFEPVNLPRKDQRNLEMLLDIPLDVTVELGRTNRRIEDILDLSPGSIIELDKLAGEPVDVLVNQKRVAKGEVVVIDENFGVRVTDIISQNDRIMKLN